MNLEEIQNQNKVENGLIEEKESSSVETNDNAELKIESQTNMLNANLESANKEFIDVGGEIGISKALDTMSPETKSALNDKIGKLQNNIKNKEYILKNGKNENATDELWDLTKAMLSGNLVSKREMNYDFIDKFQRITGNGMGVVLGLAMLPSISTMKGLQQLNRKIKLALDKIKLRKLQSKNL